MPATSVPAAATPPTTTPISNVVVLMQENHSFDNYFGTRAGVDGLPDGTCMPRVPGTAEPCVQPFHIGGKAIRDLAHTEAAFADQFRDGQLDGFVWAHDRAGADGAQAMGYYDDRDLPYYWNIADEYVLFDRFFTSAHGGSVRNHMYAITGQPGAVGPSEAVPTDGWGDIPTIFDRLEEKGISWKFYIQNYDPTITYRTRLSEDVETDRGAQVIWAPLLAYARYIDDPNLSSRIVDLDQYYEDVANGELPAVSFIRPSGNSEHPPGSVQAGQRLIRSLLNQLMRSSQWSSSAFLWSYDDWGGLVRPCQPAGRRRVRLRPAGTRAAGQSVRPPRVRGPRDPRLHLDPAVDPGQLGPRAAGRPGRGGRSDARGVRLHRGPATRGAALDRASSGARGPTPDLGGLRRLRPGVCVRGRTARRAPSAEHGAPTPGTTAPGGVSVNAIGPARRASARATCVLVIVLAALVTGPATLAAQDQPGTLVIQTVPALAGAQFRADGVTVSTDSAGVARLPVRTFVDLDRRFEVLPTQIDEHLRVELDRMLGSPTRRRGETLIVGLRLQRLVTYRFAGPDQREIAPQRISRLVLKSNTGETAEVVGAELHEPRWVAASRTQQTPTGLASKDLYWTVDRVVVDGAEVVNRGQQRFVPNQQRDWAIKLLFYQVRVTGQDLLFGGAAGSGVELHRPDGVVEQVPFTDGWAELARVPRGDYSVRVYGSGLSFLRPVGISKDQELILEVITPWDLWLVGSLLVGLAVGLAAVGRRRKLRALTRRLAELDLPRRPARRRRGGPIGATRSLVVVLAASVALAPAGLAPGAIAPVAAVTAVSDQAPSAPVLAYYYIWYNPTSWRRAKQDYPLLGRYSSADPEVARQHVRLAASAGLAGFLVSWKHTDFLDPRLDQLVEIARQQDFKLGIVYQGLDFAREPLPVAQVASDLRYFVDRYADDPVFDLFGEPIVIITGTERYSVTQLREIVEPVRPWVTILASAKNVEDYERVAALVDGDAYYWSSGDPGEQFYREKLARMGETVQAHGGLWFAPATAGFDARDLGGHRVIEREGGETLRRGIATAGESEPAAIAVISWNEFSENSHIEPSEQHGTLALETLAELTGGSVDQAGVGLGSSEPEPRAHALPGWLAIMLTVLLVALLPLALLVRQRRRG